MYGMNTGEERSENKTVVDSMSLHGATKNLYLRIYLASYPNLDDLCVSLGVLMASGGHGYY